VAIWSSMPKILETWKAFGDMTGRYYKPIETYKAEDAETLLVTMGSFGETASVAVDKLREGKIGWIGEDPTLATLSFR